MTKRPSKKELREQLNRDTSEFLQHGGCVNEVQRGVSGLINGRYDESSIAFEQKQDRTPVSEVLNTIDERREQMKEAKRSQRSGASSPSHSTKRPKKKIIYDDFGEPLRVVWE